MIGMTNLIASQPDSAAWLLVLQGQWTVPQLPRIRQLLQSLSPPAVQTIVVKTAEAAPLDISIAWLLYQHAQQWQQQGYQVVFPDFPSEYQRYFALQAPESGAPLTVAGSLRQPVVRLGKAGVAWGKTLYSWVSFFGQGISSIGLALLDWRQLRWRAVLHHVFATGISAMPVVALIACLISIVITYQGGAQLRDLGAEMYTIDMVAISVLRELGVLLTAIMVAGRSGSAFAAEIGLMKTNQEVDALRVMGSEPFFILVVPRILALLIALPLLTVLADAVALLAAAGIAMPLLDISFTQFIARIHTQIGLQTFLAGLIKAPFFALVIALIGCWQGMRVTGSSESLGQHTTKAVVDAIFVVLLLDALFSVLFYRLGF